MASGGYRKAIAWIGSNDGDAVTACDPKAHDPAELESLLLVVFTADLFGKTPETVARAVRAYVKRAARNQ